MSLATEIARELYKIEAIQIKPDRSFTWTSGIKSPIYCDNRLTLSYPDIREKIADAFVTIIKAQEEQPDVIAGCATAGIPHAAWIAQKLNLPMVYVRSKPKGHGKGNQIEGDIKEGQKVVVIEDLISTGGSSINAALALQEAGANVIGVLAIFSYGLAKATNNFKANGFPLTTISNFDSLLDELLVAGTINKENKADLIEWRDSLSVELTR
ncbi:orotate phosphoribosyltransferase [Aquibacillus salsiterrae]|uniref:Orotate phosphoribosyltransferase n=1 Tax=Aquibacillus salsiterrae TaxID=2950439 RepID=A0A9X3WDH6_9BACI|nr:orotate phosphoribosyltransferase [Aquibacillus salsiterrae]MDC3416451.1 orotate phosphoribosyltransferase [Aquibacillus salsiterrae]